MSQVVYVPPREPLVDPRTGYVSRIWYLFFQRLMDPNYGRDIDELALLVGNPDGLHVQALDGGLEAFMPAPAAEPAVDYWSPPVVQEIAFDIPAPRIPADITPEEFAAMMAQFGAALPTFADEAAASGLSTGQFYKTATGELRVKL